MSFKGDLENVQLADLFQTLASNQQEGVLTMSTEERSRRIRFSNEGVSIVDPVVASHRRLGDILVSAQLVSREQIDDALRIQENTDPRPFLGEVLVQQGLLHEAELQKILQLQVEEELYDLFRLPGGRFEFHEEHSVQTQFSNLIPFQVDSVVLEAARRLDEWRMIETCIPDLDAVYRPLVSSMPCDDQEEALVLAQLDGRRSVRETADSLLTSIFLVARILSRLVDQERVRKSSVEDLLNEVRECLDEEEKEAGRRLLHQIRRQMPDETFLPELTELFRAVGDGRASAELGLRVARLAAEEGDLQRAREILEQADRDWPHAIPVLTPLADILAGQGDTDNEFWIRNELSYLNLESGNADGAVRCMERLVELRPDDRELRHRFVDTCLRARRREQALKILVEDVRRTRRRGTKRELITLYKRILAVDTQRSDVKKALKKLQRTRAEKAVRAGVMGFVLLVLTSFSAFEYLRMSRRRQGLADVAQAAEMLAIGKLREANVVVRGVLDDHSNHEVVTAARQLMDKVDRALSEASVRERRETEKALDEELAAIQAELDAEHYRDALAGVLRLLEQPHQPSLKQRVRLRLRVVSRAFLTAATRARERATRFRVPRRDQDVPRVLAELAEFFSPSIERELQGLLSLQKQARAELDAGTRDWLDQMSAGTMAWLEDHSRLLPLMEELGERRRRLEVLENLSEDYLTAERALRNGQLELAQRLYRTVLEQYGEGELRPMLEQTVQRLDRARSDLAAVDDLVAAGRIEQAHDHALALLEDYKDFPVEQMLSVPVEVTSLPPQAMVHLDGEEAGITPMVLRVPPVDSVRVTVHRQGFDPYDVEVHPLREHRVEVILTRESVMTLNLSGTFEAGATWHEGRIYVANRTGIVSRIDPSTGQVDGRFDSGSLGGSLTTPLATPHGILVTVVEGRVFLLDTASARLQKPLWEEDVGESLRLQPVLDGEQVLFATERGNVVALELESGRRLWRLKNPGRSIVSTPVLAGDRLHLAMDGGEVVTYTLADRKPVQRRSIRGDVFDLQVMADGTLVITTSSGRVILLDATSGEELLSLKTHGLPDGPPLLHRDRLYLTQRRRLVRLDLEHGVELPKKELEETASGALAVVDGLLLVGTESGNIEVFDALTGEYRARYRSEGDAIISPIVPIPEGLLILCRRGHLRVFSR